MKLSAINLGKKRNKGYIELQRNSHAYCTHMECTEARAEIKQSWQACRYYIRGYQNGVSVGYRKGYTDGLWNGALVKLTVKKK